MAIMSDLDQRFVLRPVRVLQHPAVLQDDIRFIDNHAYGVEAEDLQSRLVVESGLAIQSLGRRYRRDS